MLPEYEVLRPHVGAEISALQDREHGILFIVLLYLKSEILILRYLLRANIEPGRVNNRQLQIL